MSASTSNEPPGTERRTYAPVGKCIYCGSTESLTDEHIVPYGLGGNYILPKSSCKVCARETGRVEQRCLKHIMWAARLRQNIQSRSKRPPTLTAKITNEQGQQKLIDVPVGEYPDYLFLMNLKPPGILIGTEPRPEIEGKIWGCELGGHEEFHERVKKLGARYLIARPVNMTDLIRMLAKIGHAYAVTEPELPPFSPLLPDLILGRYKTPSYLVGCLGEPSPPEPDVTHRVNSQLGEISKPGAPTTVFVLVRIRLFACLGAPEYHVVVGRA